MDREQLEGLWSEATALQDATESPLAIAIIEEAVACGEADDGIDGIDPTEAARAVRVVAKDCEDFAQAIEAA